MRPLRFCAPRVGRLAASALIGSALCACPPALVGQDDGGRFVATAVGLGFKRHYGVSEREGPVLGVAVGRFVARRAALRFDAEVQVYDGGRVRDYVDAPCPRDEQCPGGDIAVIPAQGAGSIVLISALAGSEWYEQADRRGFYLLGGAGLQAIVAHPDRAAGLRLAVQAGTGISLDGVAQVEARYGLTLGARAEPRRVVLLTMRLRPFLRSEGWVRRCCFCAGGDGVRPSGGQSATDTATKPSSAPRRQSTRRAPRRVSGVANRVASSCPSLDQSSSR